MQPGYLQQIMAGIVTKKVTMGYSNMQDASEALKAACETIKTDLNRVAGTAKLRMHPSYTWKIFESPQTFKRTVDQVCKKLDLLAGKHQFDTIVGSGLSAVPLIGAVSALTGREMMLVRRKEEGSHDEHRVAGCFGSSYIIIDDLIDTGHTVRYITSTIEKEFRGRYGQARPPPDLAAILLYHTDKINHWARFDVDGRKFGVYTLQSGVENIGIRPYNQERYF